MRLLCSDGREVAVPRALCLTEASPPLALANSLDAAGPVKVSDTCQEWMLIAALLNTKDQSSFQERLERLRLLDVQTVLHIAHKYDMASLMRELDQHLHQRLPVHLSMHTKTHGYLLTWLDLTDRGPLPLTLDAILATVANPSSALGKRGLLSELGTARTDGATVCRCRGGPSGGMAPAGACRECVLDVQLETLSLRTLARLVRAVAQAGRELQKTCRQDTLSLDSAPSHLMLAPAGSCDSWSSVFCSSPTPLVGDPHLLRPAAARVCGGAFTAESRRFGDPGHAEVAVGRCGDARQACDAQRCRCGPACIITGVCVCGGV